MSPANSYSLSKSKVMLGLQCEKALYLNVHHPELASEASDAQQLVFDQGHEVGVAAQKLFPNGVLIDAPITDSRLAIDQTRSAMAFGALHIYEATFKYSNVLVKVDILSRASVHADWEIIEVKSSTSAKEVHITDAAIQLWVLRGAGLKIKSTSILHINNDCVFPKLENLFTREDVSFVVEEFQKQIPAQLESFQKILNENSAPPLDIGIHCGSPYDCAFKNHCWKEKRIPELSVFNIPRLSEKKKWELYQKGSLSLQDVDARELNPAQKRMIDCSVKNERFIDSQSIRSEIKNWKYPLAFLDFETMGYAIPRFQGMRPYEQLPFQFSCHIQRSRESKVEHTEYLHTDASDPRESLAKALVALVPQSGTVVAYNKDFEKRVLVALAEKFSEYSADLFNIAERLVDPLPIIRAHVYDPQFAGSFSIKNVAPAILGESASYKEMEVGGGTEAQSAYLKMLDVKTSPEQKSQLKDHLLAYCKKDTEGMMNLVLWLQRV